MNNNEETESAEVIANKKEIVDKIMWCLKNKVKYCVLYNDKTDMYLVEIDEQC